MTSSGQEATERLLAYLSRLRRRSRWQRSLRVALTASAVFAVALLTAAGLSGPVVSPRWAGAAWAACLLPPLLVVGWALGRHRRRGGAQAARLLSAHAPELAMPLQSAVELLQRAAQEVPETHSPELVEAHVRAVAARVATVSPAVALPWSDLRRPSVGLSLLGTLFGGLLMLGHPRLHGGIVALTHPARESDDGMLTAPIVEGLQARLIFPSYLRRDPEPVENPDDVTAPIGTTLEVRLRARLPAQEALLVLGKQRMRLSFHDGGYQGRIVVREDSALEIQMRNGSQWYRDATERRVRALSDNAPRVTITSPSNGGWIDAEQPLVVSFQAADSEGLADIDLRLRLADGRDVRRPVWSALGLPVPPAELNDQMAFVPADLGVQQGDRIELWLEARDGDAVTGPNVGESEHLTLEALSHAQHLSQHLPLLKAVLDQGLVSLADRLEQAVPEESDAARDRNRRLGASMDAWLSSIDGLTGALEQQPTDSLGLDREQLDAMAKRLRRKRTREEQLHRHQVGTLPARTRADAALVDESEKDVILLADLLAQSHLDEANALAAELKDLKARMQDLLKALSESDSEEAKQELLAEIARAERRLRELMRSMSELAAHVPSEFVNQDAMQDANTSAAMEDLKSSIQEGDLDAAAKHLEALEQQLDALAQGLESGGLRFREARFGPRDEALMRAREQLAMLSEEQSTLAQQSAEQTREIMGRGAERETQRDTQGLQRMAQQAADRLSQLENRPMGSSERRLHEQASARLQDARDALRTGDLSEAQRMSAASQRATDQLARNMENDAQMYPGHDGMAGEDARSARAASEQMRALQQAIDAQTPELSERMTGEDARRMQQQAERQRRARAAADQLRDALEKGPEGLPLSPDGADSVERAQDAMRRAERELEGGDLQGATMMQEEAADQLQELSEELARKQSQQSGGGRSASRADGDGDINGRVRIPDAEDFEAPTERRRRILDAMREGSPPGYATAVDEYYRELLR